MRFNPWKARQDLVATVFLYPPGRGGRAHAIEAGWSCSCIPANASDEHHWQGWPLLNSVVLHPGESGCFGWMFAEGEQATARLREAGSFLLWEERIIGEARVLG